MDRCFSFLGNSSVVLILLRQFSQIGNMIILSSSAIEILNKADESLSILDDCTSPANTLYCIRIRP